MAVPQKVLNRVVPAQVRNPELFDFKGFLYFLPFFFNTCGESGPCTRDIPSDMV
jgi:hypothetical protein